MACPALGGLLALATQGPAAAQVAACVLLPGSSGELSLGGDLMSWRTTSPATISVTNIARVQLFVTTPGSWASAPGGTPATSFGLSGTLSGANGGAMTSGGGGLSATLTGIGSTVAAVSLRADAGSPFRSGQHVAQVTVTCSQ